MSVTQRNDWDQDPEEVTKDLGSTGHLGLGLIPLLVSQQRTRLQSGEPFLLSGEAVPVPWERNPVLEGRAFLIPVDAGRIR